MTDVKFYLTLAMVSALAFTHGFLAAGVNGLLVAAVSFALGMAFTVKTLNSRLGQQHSELDE